MICTFRGGYRNNSNRSSGCGQTINNYLRQKCRVVEQATLTTCSSTTSNTVRAVYRNFAKGSEFEVWKKEWRGGRKLTIVLCEAQGGCYTLHLLC